MVNAQTRKLAFLFACCVVVLFISAGIKSSRNLNEKTRAQSDVTESFQRWRHSYLALSDSRVRWDKNYRRESSVQDIVSLFELVGLERYALSADTDKLVLTKVEQVTQNNAPIGLTKICMATGSGDGASLAIQASDYQSLINGIEKLAKRDDVFIGNISFQGDKPIPVARLGDFCVLLRND